MDPSRHDVASKRVGGHLALPVTFILLWGAEEEIMRLLLRFIHAPESLAGVPWLINDDTACRPAF